ncbi:hypothetical protein AXF42_Ash000072 [Apostasia shenzhenica]|uniref:J domain-containing protein n=1 Tax=Apostasia shenzhenica TaxID=1088818 RepID=A0A2I0AFA1_9ASPA|nr:hypothetical protein AXF42_Ash000072 [Apostasia shenzhenica]
MGNDRDRWEEPERGSLSWLIFFGLMGATATTFAASRLRRTFDWVYNQLRSQSGRRYSNRMQEEYEEEMERVERIRRMQSVFNRARSKYQKTYERWQDQGPGAYQHSPRNDWYFEADESFKNRTNYRAAPGGPKPSGCHMWSHHYAVLGLDRYRAKPYSDAEIKTAFRAKAMECHPDQNQQNKDAAEEKFKEVLKSYEAIKWERNNTNR